MKTSLAALILCVCAAGSACAQSAAPLYVSFSFAKTSAPINFSGVTKAEVEAQIGKQIATILQERFPVWSIVPSTKEGEFPQLKVWLTESSDWDLLLQLQGPGKVAYPKAHWQTVLLKPGDLARLAGTMNSSGWLKLVLERTNELLFESCDVIQDALLANVPVGQNLKLDDPPQIQEPQVFTVLPLDWDIYGAQLLGISEFTIQCLSSDGPVKLHSVGIGRSETFTPRNPRGYSGVVVRLTEWEDSSSVRSPVLEHKEQLAQLRPLGIYLRAINPVDLRVAP